MADRRPEPLTVGEAKSALIEWGRGVDREATAIFRRHKMAWLGSALGAGIVLGVLSGKRAGRATRWRRDR